VSENVVPVWPVPSRDDLEPILRVGYKSMILEADEWRPLAQYVHDLCRACVRGAEERLEAQVAAMREVLERVAMKKDALDPSTWDLVTVLVSSGAGVAYQREHEALLEVFRWARLFAAHECLCHLINGGRGPKCAACQLRAAIAGLHEVRRAGSPVDAEDGQ